MYISRDIKKKAMLLRRAGLDKDKIVEKLGLSEIQKELLFKRKNKRNTYSNKTNDVIPLRIIENGFIYELIGKDN